MVFELAVHAHGFLGPVEARCSVENTCSKDRILDREITQINFKITDGMDASFNYCDVKFHCTYVKICTPKQGHGHGYSHTAIKEP
jgi:hypothetical protein